jgi:hypothetical protein
VTIRVKIYVDGKLKKVFTEDIGEDEHIGLQNTLLLPVCGREIAESRNNTWSRDVRWEIEVIR